ncbi:urate hydroxylase PuuD [Methylobacterium sp. JK268]
MDPILHEWGSFLIRWTHVVAAIAWIGASFYFMHLDASLRAIAEIPAGKGGEAWEVHGGGFYQVRKYLVAPDRLPEHLIWHKWQSYSTWLSGFALLCWIYYGQAELYLIDPAVRPIAPLTGAGIGLAALALGWLVYDGLNRSALAQRPPLLAGAIFLVVVAFAYGFQQVFSGRAAMLHTGAVIATWMTGNVFFVIMPNQRKAIAELVAGRVPNPAWGKQAKNRSSHNNSLTLPVLFFMLSGHAPMVWSTAPVWAIVGLVVITGGVVRHFFNVRNAGGGDRWWTWGVAAACVLLAAAISIASSPAGRQRLGLAAAAQVAAADHPDAEWPAPDGPVMAAIGSRCSMCHAPEPLWPGLATAPKGVLLDTPEHVARFAPAIRLQAVLTRAMPPGNVTDMQPEEREDLARWLAER